VSSKGPVSEAKVVATLSLLYVFRMLGLFMVFPVMMLFGAKYAGATPFLLGMALGIYGLTQAVFQIPLGLLSDVWGRKPVILLGLVIFALGSVVAACADDVWWLILGRAIQGAGAMAGAVMALVGDLTSEQNRTRAMAVIGISIGLSFSVSMVVGPMLAAVGGLTLIFWLTAALAVVGMIILYALVPEPPQGVRHGSDGLTVPSLLRNALKNADLVRLDFGIFVLHFVLTATFVVVPVAFDRIGVVAEKHWHIYLPVMLISFIAMMPFMYVAERKRKMKKVFLAAVFLLVIAEAGLSFAADLWHWILGLFIFFTAFNLLEATLPSLVSKQAPAGSKGTAMGMYSTCQFLGASAGGVVGGLCYQYWGLASVLIVSVVLCALWFIAALGMRPPRFLKSICLSQPGAVDAQAILGDVPGVVEAFWVKEQALLYLKVDEHLFNMNGLTQYLQGQD
jgi:MFS family permease